MMCKKHPLDQSSSNGVCATCLRERLLVIIEAQSQAKQEPDQARIRPDPNPPQLLLPRSVSPYISRRKSDTSSATWHHHHRHHHMKKFNSLPDQKFFSTPQIGPNNGGINIDHDHHHKKKNKNKFNLFSKLFKSGKKVNDSDSRESTTTVTSSPAWFPNLLTRKKQIKRFSADELAIKRLRDGGGDRRGRGMSPAVDSDEEIEAEPSGYTSDEWRYTPKRTPAQWRGGGRSSQLSRNVSGISFCLSPMVRASPGQNWTHKGGGAPPEMVVSGEIRMPIKAHSITASLCKNRSRKLADFGRSSQNR
ncbi:hypothetical protein Leryth_014172 [Lithospermum erythrorhizon]|nr:hypothetical protein Leryth_014172 [Lithospermum erythrorhizon]